MHTCTWTWTCTWTCTCNVEYEQYTLCPHLDPIVNPGAVGVDWREAILADDTLDGARHLHVSNAVYNARCVMQYVMHYAGC